jgi:iron(III) transport system substrate-binding protein
VTRTLAWWALCLLLCGCELHLGPMQPAQGDDPGAAPARADDRPQGELWVYTSLYQPVIEALSPMIERDLPGVRVQWYRAGSEKVATRLDTELAAGGTQADLILTSDPAWYLGLKKDNRLAAHANLGMLPLSREYIDPDGHYATCRVSTMVIAYHPDAIAEQELPRSFRALTEPHLRGKVTLGDPLTSGTHFTTTAFLSRRYGWTFYEALRANGALANGGNSAVLGRVEAREFPVGVVLLENVLANQAQGSPVRFLLPQDGVITIPGYVGLLASTDNPAAARALYDLLMSPQGQLAMTRGQMHSANPAISPPQGAPPFDQMTRGGGFTWSPAFTEEIHRDAADIKTRFDQIMNR